MIWTFIVLLLWPDGRVTELPSETYATRVRCEQARVAEARKMLPRGAEGRLIGGCRERPGA